MEEVINLIDINSLKTGVKRHNLKKAGMVIYNIIAKKYIAKIQIENSKSNNKK